MAEEPTWPSVKGSSNSFSWAMRRRSVAIFAALPLIIKAYGLSVETGILAEKILILHSLLSGLDILTAIILLVAVLSGLATGLVVKLGQIVAVIGSYVIAAVLASYVGLGREIVFVVAFIVLSIICRYLVQVLRLVDKIPVVGTLDKFGGAVVGFVVAFIVLYFVINLFFDIVPQSTLDGMGWTKEAVQKTMFIKGFLKR